TRLLEMKDDRFTIEHQIVSEALDDIATLGDGLVVSFHYASGKKAPLPAELRERIRLLEASVGRGCGTQVERLFGTPHGLGSISDRNLSKFLRRFSSQSFSMSKRFRRKGTSVCSRPRSDARTLSISSFVTAQPAARKLRNDSARPQYASLSMGQTCITGDS